MGRHVLCWPYGTAESILALRDGTVVSWPYVTAGVYLCVGLPETLGVGLPFHPLSIHGLLSIYFIVTIIVP